MLKKSIVALAVGTVVTLAGCSSSPNEEVYERIAALEEAKAEMRENYEEVQQEKREDEIDALPDWVLEPPQPDATGMYAVGIGESRKLKHALKIARLEAEFQMAKMYQQELSGSERSFEQGDSDGNVSEQTTFLIDKIVDSVPVVGYEIIEQVAQPMAGKHNIYVLMKLPYDEFNKILQQQKASSMNAKVQQSFDDLERRLDKRRQQRLEEEQQRFDREQEAMKNRADMLSNTTSDKADSSERDDKLPPVKVLQKI